MTSLSDNIDDSLYSRQRYVLGDKAMHSLALSNVLIVGMGSLGAEIAKNIVLAGVQSVTLLDNTKCSNADLGGQFFIRESDVLEEKTRSVASMVRLQELNNYVKVKVVDHPLEPPFANLSQYQCIVVTEADLKAEMVVDKFCRENSIKFISANVYGVFCSVFCDFGINFEVFDDNGEEAKEFFISDVTRDIQGIVSTLDFAKHMLETDDVIEFRQVKGMQELNGKQFVIKVISPYSFSIGDTSLFSSYDGGGLVKQVKMSKKCNFKDLSSEIKSPSYTTPDLCKLNAPLHIHACLLTLELFRNEYHRMPSPWCIKDSMTFLNIAKGVIKENNFQIECLNEKYILDFAHTCAGELTPLCAFVGGVVGQEVLKACTGKFTPLQQWLHLDAKEIIANVDINNQKQFLAKNSRYDRLRACIGMEMLESLAKQKIFMVGCGAIGCELLKNFAILGLASDKNGEIVITDNDLIEKSNLNRQFLFRSQHVQSSKSTTAAKAILEINPGLNIVSHQHKVCSESENIIFNDDFFDRIDINVNALDNLEARRYMDGRCVTCQKPLLDTGTMSTKGHVQVIVPFVTESYTSQVDPVDTDSIPYCTLRSFPSSIIHCIEWARDKFQNTFTQKTSTYNEFWSKYTLQECLKNLESEMEMKDVSLASRWLEKTPLTWDNCLCMARLKFEKLFNHKAKQLLYCFPLDTKNSDGTLFWQLPKRPPNPVIFDANNQVHLLFVSTYAKLLATINRIDITNKDLTNSCTSENLQKFKVPEFQPKDKVIETDETVEKSEVTIDEDSDVIRNRLTHAFKRLNGQNPVLLKSIEFEKDDDTNGHIDYIYTASCLRAEMYGIELVDRLEVKRIAGRIIPAIATTTAAIAGLATLELIKIVLNLNLESFRNSFLNLAIPVFVLSEPANVKKMVLSTGLEFTLWDRWEIRGDATTTVGQFLEMVRLKYGCKPVFVVQNMKFVYSEDLLILHKKRLNKPINDHIKKSNRSYVDLIIAFKHQTINDTEICPQIRYYF